MRLRDVNGFEREIRDPIHRYIKLTPIENAVVDSRYFSRLANISQMHSAHLVYPGATYARKAHSFGAMAIAHRIICRILHQQYQTEIDKASHCLLYIDNPKRRGWKAERDLPLRQALEDEGFTFVGSETALIPAHLIQAVRLAALLHDVGHGPLSHLFESASQQPNVPRGQKAPRYDHEEKSVALIRQMGEASDLGPALLEPDDADFVARIVSNDLRSPDLRFLHEIISSPLDADKMDYILRDSHYTGTREYGTIDLDRILDAFIVAEGRLCYASESLDAVVNALNAMFFMYNNVYLHRTVRAFDVAALEGLRPLHEFFRAYQDETPPRLPSGDLAKHFLDLDDATLLGTLEMGALQEKGTKTFVNAAAALYDLRHRRKAYKALVDARLAIPVGVARSNAAYQESIEAIETKLKELAKGLVRNARLREDDVRVDLEKNIRPIGLKTDDLLKFLQEEVIFDVQRQELASFRAYHHHYKTLTRIVVPVRIYCRVDAYPRIPEAIRLHTCEEALGVIRRAEETLFDTTR